MVLDVIRHFLDQKMHAGSDGQFFLVDPDEIESRRITLGTDDTDEPHGITHGRKDREDIVLFDPAEVANVDVIGVETLPRLILQGYDLPPDDGPTIEELVF